MFIGEYSHSIDTKGRIAIPAKFRQQLSGSAIITRGFDSCLFVFTSEQWQKLAEKINSLPMTQANSRSFSRLMFAGAVSAEVDAQGRILVPDYLRQYAGIKKQAVVAGLFNRLEIWDSAKWEEYKKKTESSSDEIAERLGEMGI